MQIVLRLILFKILIVLLRAVKRALDYGSEEMNRMNECIEEKEGIAKTDRRRRGRKICFSLHLIL